MNEQEFLQYLHTHDIPCERFEHPAVFTCAEAELHRPRREAVSTKNLFLCDKKARRFFLVVTACEKTMDLLRLGEQIGVPRLRFASQENLMRLLGVTPGAVTMMGLVNDSAGLVELWIDAEIWRSDLFQSHPLVNTATLLLSRTALERFFELTGHSPHFLQA
ncbi:MAG TPA: prolyl-tRNA synthetase associated domain-containing protein [Anaerolineales bacterium]|jgi:Ala-tRNA(Pro) deacylase